MSKNNQKNSVMNFRTESISAKMKDADLDSILDKIQVIEFDEIFYENDPDKLHEIINLKRCLRSEEFAKQYKQLREDLCAFQPDIETQILISVLNLLSILNTIEYRISLFEDGEYRIYTPQLKYWKRLDKKIVSQFLSMVAEKSGIDRQKAITKNNRDLMLFHFNERAYSLMPEKSVNKVTINLQNGTYEISDDFIGLREHRPTDYLFYILPFSYDNEATCPMFDKFLEIRLPEEKARMALAEMSAYPLCPHLKLELSAVLQGPGKTGKSTFCTILTKLYGEENVSGYTLTNLCSPGNTSDYNRAQLKNYILNYSSEMGGRGCEPNIVKKFISREPIEARHPYKDSFTLRNYCPTMFNVNELSMVENTSAYWRRFIYFPFHVVVKSDELDVTFADKIIASELPGVFNWLLQGLQRLRTNEKVTYSPLCQSLKNSLKREMDPVSSFLFEEGYRPTVKGDHYELTAYLFKQFTKYCEDCNIKAKHMGRTRFIKRLEENGIYVDRNAPNHQYRAYCEKETEVERQKRKENDNIIEKLLGISKSE